MTPLNLVPIVRTDRNPDNIILFSMSSKEVVAIKGHLAGYRKSNIGWDTYRAKIPDELLNKWHNVLRECRMSGYVNPRATLDNIIWDQAVDTKSGDRCIMCPNAYPCKGKSIDKENKKDFIPCWVPDAGENE